MLLTRVVDRHYEFQGFRPLRCLELAIREADPDLILPCDELAALQLHRLHAQLSASQSETSASVCAVIERSLGNPESYPLLESRNSFLALAAEEGIPVPATEVVESIADVERWVVHNGLPAVLKADGTSGGEGVKIVESTEEALLAFRTLKAPLSTPVTAKRTLIDRDPNLIVPWLRRRERSVSIQPYIRGWDANIAVACWKGEVLASVSIRVLNTSNDKGPATIVRVLPDDDMLQAARAVVRRLGLSGLCGLDFMVHAETGVAHLIELNARATQTGHFPLGPGHDLPAALTAALMGHEPRERSQVIHSDVIALFPLAWHGNPVNPLLKTAYHDVPWEEPELVRAGLAKPSPINYPNFVQLTSKLRPGLRLEKSPKREL